jgi:hypothetical protein
MGWFVTRHAELQLHSGVPVEAATTSPGNS